MKTQIKGKGQGVIVNDNLEQYVKSDNSKTTISLENGKSAITMQGGKLYPLSYKEVLAGEYIKEYKITNLTRIITPFVPTLDRIYIKISAYFVPLTRIWDNSNKALAQKYDQEAQNYGQLIDLPYARVNGPTTEYAQFRDTLAARYGIPNNAKSTQVNTLLFRGYRAIFNDFIRNKEYELPKVEWKTDGNNEFEEEAVNAYDTDDINAGYIRQNAYIVEAAPTRKTYLTNIKKSMENSNDEQLDDINGWATAYAHLDWQTRYMKTKQDIANANKNDWDIIAEMGGTQPINYDQVELLGEIDYELNYQQITQSAPQIDDSAPLGTTGSFSYTKAQGVVFSHKEFKQHGHIHLLIQLNIDKQYEESTNKELLKLSIDDIYRPALAKKEMQLLKQGEVCNNNAITRDMQEGIAYQPPWAEYKRTPNIVSGDMRSQTLAPLGPVDTNGNPLEDYTMPYATISQSQWHNIVSRTDLDTINDYYFRPAGETNTVLARNNLIATIGNPDEGSVVFNKFWDDPILNMTEIQIKTSLPIQSSTINQVSKAEETR